MAAKKPAKPAAKKKASVKKSAIADLKVPDRKVKGGGGAGKIKFNE